MSRFSVAKLACIALAVGATLVVDASIAAAGCGGRAGLLSGLRNRDCCGVPVQNCCPPVNECGGRGRILSGLLSRGCGGGLLARRSDCCAPAPTCCPAPAPTCCPAPAPSCCAAAPSCCEPAPTCCQTASTCCDSNPCGGRRIRVRSACCSAPVSNCCGTMDSGCGGCGGTVSSGCVGCNSNVIDSGAVQSSESAPPAPTPSSASDMPEA